MATIRYPSAELGAERKAPRAKNRRSTRAADADAMKAFVAGLAVMGVAAAVSAKTKNPLYALGGLVAGVATTGILLERMPASAT